MMAAITGVETCRNECDKSMHIQSFIVLYYSRISKPILIEQIQWDDVTTKNKTKRKQTNNYETIVCE
jgi:hypothetical protein